jgi:hypothetical protein
MEAVACIDVPRVQQALRPVSVHTFIRIDARKEKMAGKRPK